MLGFIKRLIRQVGQNLWRNVFLSVVTVFLGTLIIFLLNFVLGLRFFADYSLQQIEQRADFLIPLRERYEVFELDALTNELRTQTAVSTSILPPEIKLDYQLPARLRLRFSDLSEVESALEIVKKLRYDSVVGNWERAYEQDFLTITQQAHKLKTTVQSVGNWVLLIFVLGGVLLAFNTCQVIIFSRRSEIYIARLVGAKFWVISLPYIAEALVLGVCSALLGIGLFVLVLQQISLLPGGEIFLHLWNTAFAQQVFFSGLVGGAGAWWAMRRYLFQGL